MAKGDKKAQGKSPSVAKTETTTPLQVEVHFPIITDLKQAIAFDADGNLMLAIAFKSRVDQYEIFRLVNLLKQPHGTLYATLGSPQSAMDFKFTKDGRVEIVKAQIAAEKKTSVAALVDEAASQESGKAEPIIIQDINFNHIPEEDRPFGVAIDFIIDETGVMHTVAGRGNTATEAIIAGVKATKGFPEDLNQPFEIVEALKKTKETPALIKTIRAIEVGSFDLEEGKEGESESKGD